MPFGSCKDAVGDLDGADVAERREAPLMAYRLGTVEWSSLTFASGEHVGESRENGFGCFNFGAMGFGVT